MRTCLTCENMLREEERLWCDGCMRYAELVAKGEQAPLDPEEFQPDRSRKFAPIPKERPLWMRKDGPPPFYMKEAKA